MKNRKKLAIALVLAALAAMFGRFAWIYIHESIGVVLIILSAVCVVAALTIFAIYFSEY
ncbi:hypothetical protein SAMN05421747_101504 [Parapedobacter composti]|uniref:Uncharacterized protein n=1 Tax=Parapedobacter composti TaxID=623281 RepID=A0A1I1ED51_9SPHI|nr:hypothetical protein [Parapedobacter composti]SFB84987.1 hypothetical protein SAMN05421747_101504 [Parapedobacter composti]